MRIITESRENYRGVFVLTPEGKNEVNVVEIQIRQVKNYPDIPKHLIDVAARAAEKALKMEIELIAARDRVDD